MCPSNILTLPWRAAIAALAVAALIPASALAHGHGGSTGHEMDMDGMHMGGAGHDMGEMDMGAAGHDMGGPGKGGAGHAAPLREHSAPGHSHGGHGAGAAGHSKAGATSHREHAAPDDPDGHHDAATAGDDEHAAAGHSDSHGAAADVERPVGPVIAGFVGFNALVLLAAAHLRRRPSATKRRETLERVRRAAGAREPEPTGEAWS